MAFRRRRSFRSFPRRRFRRGSFLRAPSQPARWSVGQVVIAHSTDMSAENGNNQTWVFPIAQIPGHLGDFTPQGNTLDNAARFLEVGGLVLNWWFGEAVGGDEAWPDGEQGMDVMTHRLFLVSDRLAAGSPPLPVAIPNWFRASTPVITAGTADEQETQDEFPTRIHWQGARFYQRTIINDDDIQGSVAPLTQPIERLAGSFNRRLRLRLGDRDCVALHWAIQRSNPRLGTEVAVFFRAVGTIYYRFRFG